MGGSRLFNQLTGVTEQEFPFTPEDLAQLGASNIKTVLKMDKFIGSVHDGSLKNTLISIGNELDTFAQQVTARIGLTQQNKELLQNEVNGIDQSNADINTLLEILPPSDPDVRSSTVLFDMVEGTHESFIIFLEGNEELLYRIDQVDKLNNSLIAQKTNLLDLRGSINSVIAIIDQINSGA